MKRPTIFDDIVRTDNRPSRHLEGHFRFLNRAAGPVFERMRALLEEWLQRYPAHGRADVRGRLRAGADSAFMGAFWELYQYETLTRMGFDVSLHPDVLGTGRRPDFLVRRPGERGFYLEATLAGPSLEEQAAKKRLAAVFDVLNSLNTPDFFLSVAVRRQGLTPPPTGQLRGELLAWLGTIDPDDLIDASGGYRSAHGYEYVWDEAGWKLRFQPIPKRPGRRGRSGRAIGLWTTGPHRVDNRGRLRQAVRTKGGRYGALDRPYALAVLISDYAVDEEDIVEALFGSVAYRITVEDTDEAQPFRQRDGSWFSEGGPQYTRLSAVMTAVNLAPSSVTRITPRVWLNPWATSPLADPLPWRTAAADPTSGTFDVQDATASPADLLDLPIDWPGPDDPFPRD